MKELPTPKKPNSQNGSRFAAELPSWELEVER
jgi:hypothetical protein